MADAAIPSAKKSNRWVYIVGVLVFLAYAVWMMGPYLRSVIVRDAAVTSRSNVATAPIDGEVVFKELGVDRVVGADGIILLVRNDRVSRQPVIEAKIRVDLARSRGEELQKLLDEVMLLDRERADLKARFADIFRSELDSKIASLERQIGVTSERLDLMGKIAGRSQELARRGTGSETAADEAQMRVSDLKLEIAELQAALDFARVRRQAADESVFITATGEDPEWVRGSRTELKLEKQHTRLDLQQARAELELATVALEEATAEFQRLSEAAVGAPPGSVVWSERVAPGATVRAGDPVAEWLDCSALMIDVPVSDAEVSLLRPGMDADVILEGESVTRRARVLLTRGSASTLDGGDLAALAKGRNEGVAQVVLEFTHGQDEFEDCPVGRSAYVDFPDVGLIDVIRARLRL
ncbi:MAG TPA: HlyD family efflux transporter periplasmic adaptor subunit [Geminicoccaceae bacterium]|nr:HlyD family efflux transporter periplasmic adaptor subunit [Geminicoccaceae bacterium]